MELFIIFLRFIHGMLEIFKINYGNNFEIINNQIISIKSSTQKKRPAGKQVFLCVGDFSKLN